MKTFLLGVTAIALMTSTVAMAQSDNHRGNQHEERGNDNRQMDHGQMGNHQMDNHRRDDRRDDNYRGNRYRHSDNGLHRGWGHDRGYGHRWNRGDRMGYNDWNSARRIDYRRYHLRQPPRGYEWRQHNDRFVMVARSSGLIMSVIIRSGR